MTTHPETTPATSSPPPRRIGLMGPFGYGNLGDAAIVEAMIQNTRSRHPDWELVGFTLNPDDTCDRHGIPSHPLSRVSWNKSPENRYQRLLARWRQSPSTWRRRAERILSRAPAEFGMLVDAYRELGSLDAMVMCGSGQLQDYWGGGGPFSYPYTMLRWTLLAKLRRIPFLVVSVGAGPVDSQLSRRFFRWALSLAGYRSYRDQWSKQYVADVIGFDRDDPVYPDLAFSLQIRPRPPEGGERPRVVGIGPIGYFRPESWPVGDDDRWERYLQMITTVVHDVIERGDKVLFLKGEAVHDQAVVDAVIEEVARRRSDLSAHLAHAPVTTVDELLDAIGRCDGIIASRFHNVLFAYALGRPVVGLSYQEKTESLMQRYGDGQRCLPIGSATAEQVLAALDDALLTTPAVGAANSQHADELAVQYDRIFELIDSRAREAASPTT